MTNKEFNKSLDEGQLTFMGDSLVPNINSFKNAEQQLLFKDISEFDIKYDSQEPIGDNLRHAIIDKQKKNNREILKHLKNKHTNNECFFVPFNVPSLKNTYVIGYTYTRNSECCKVPFRKNFDGTRTCTKCNRKCEILTYPGLKEGKPTKHYKKDTFNTWKKIYDPILKYFSNKLLPLKIAFYFIRDSRRIFDYINAAQLCQDILAQGIVLGNKNPKICKPMVHDDNMIYIHPFFIGYHIDPKTPGLLITLLDDTIHKFLKP